MQDSKFLQEAMSQYCSLKLNLNLNCGSKVAAVPPHAAEDIPVIMTLGRGSRLLPCLPLQQEKRDNEDPLNFP